MKFRKKPVVIEAMQWCGEDRSGEIYNFMKGTNRGICFDEPFLRIKTLEGEMTADKGDWIIKGVKGEFYPCKPDIFEATYEPVIEPTPREG
jgi:hypothetical protein